MNSLKASLKLFIILCWFFASPVAAETENYFNGLVKLKAGMERDFGLERLECFPFKKNVGFIEDQIQHVEKCYQGAVVLNQALGDARGHTIKVIGVGEKFLRTNGFHTVLIPWDASREEMATFLGKKISREEQVRLLDSVRELKEKILSKISPIRTLYCTQRISNEDCLRGYQTLAVGLADMKRKTAGWSEVVISDSWREGDDPESRTLRYDAPASEMKKALFQTDPSSLWAPVKKGYEVIDKKYGKAFKEDLQLAQFVCAPDLSPEECGQGADNFYRAASDPGLQGKFWGRVRVDRYNTAILDDFHGQIRYDLAPEEIVRVFSKKSPKREAEKFTVQGERYETLTKNNSSGLRVVCDLVGMQARYCVRAYENFIEFIKSGRDYQVAAPWTNLMFIDARQLSRVNFALNSKSRREYIYVDAHSSLKEMKRFMQTFARPEGPVFKL